MEIDCGAQQLRLVNLRFPEAMVDELVRNGLRSGRRFPVIVAPWDRHRAKGWLVNHRFFSKPQIGSKIGPKSEENRKTKITN